MAVLVVVTTAVVSDLVAWRRAEEEEEEEEEEIDCLRDPWGTVGGRAAPTPPSLPFPIFTDSARNRTGTFFSPSPPSLAATVVVVVVVVVVLPCSLTLTTRSSDRERTPLDFTRPSILPTRVRDRRRPAPPRPRWCAEGGGRGGIREADLIFRWGFIF